MKRGTGFALDDLGPESRERVIKIQRIALLVAISEQLVHMDVAELEQGAVIDLLITAVVNVGAGIIAAGPQGCHHPQGENEVLVHSCWLI